MKNISHPTKDTLLKVSTFSVHYVKGTIQDCKMIIMLAKGSGVRVNLGKSFTEQPNFKVPSQCFTSPLLFLCLIQWSK